MRVLFQSSSLDPKYGGPPVSEAALCQSLQQRVELEVICPEEKLVPEFARGYGLHSVRTYTTKDVQLALINSRHWLSQAMARAQIFHQNAHWRVSTSLLSRLAVQKNVPYLLHPRGILSYGHRRFFIKKMFHLALGRQSISRASAIIALSEFEAKGFASFGVNPLKVTVIPNGISYPPATAMVSPYRGESPFLYLGRVEQRKNILFLIDAFSQYRKSGGRTPLALVGPTEQGYDQVVREKIAKYGLTGEVEFYAPQYENAKWPYLKFAKALIYPALNEAFGRVPFEAVAAGTVPIFPKESGTAEYLEKYFPSTTYETAQVASLVKALLARDREPLPLDEAQAWLRETLNWSQIAGRMVSLYEKIKNDSGVQASSLRESDFA